jgi:hypothetical protein
MTEEKMLRDEANMRPMCQAAVGVCLPDNNLEQPERRISVSQWRFSVEHLEHE